VGLRNIRVRAVPALALIAGLIAGCGQRNHTAAAPELPPVQVRTQTIESKNLPVFEEVVGTVRARLRATLEAKTSGRIVAMPVVLGQKIKAGDLITRLDAPEIQARLEQAQAGLQQAERDWNRISSLFKQQAATRADFDAAESRLELAKAAVAEARALVSYVEITAPFEGVVTRKAADIGDLASPGKPLVDIEDPTALQFEAEAPEAIADKIHSRAQMTIRLGQTTGEISGTVAEIAPIADPVSRTFRVKLDLPNSPGLMSGQFGRLLVAVAESASLRVPRSAVVQRGQLEVVFVVEQQRARLHLVKTGRSIGGETEILSGLDAGDSAIIEGAAQLVDGQQVK
jgi:RND family efflux transporter MFP subunit